MKAESNLEKIKSESENKNESSEPTLFDFYNKCLEDVKKGNFWPEIKRNNEGKILSANEKTESNLPTEEIVKITRSKTFRDWFGNWDTDILVASKVIDAVTQEPLLLYHGVEHDVDYKVGPGLKPKKEYPYLHLSEIFYATSIQEHSLYWSRFIGGFEESFPLFMNIRRPLIIEEQKEVQRFLNNEADWARSKDGLKQTWGHISSDLDDENPDQFAVWDMKNVMFVAINKVRSVDKNN